uniref:Uncharacterized protein n=1 Tax=Panagrolaimus superbus TaxID=310955 RepID=A0A914YN94_9BILA
MKLISLASVIVRILFHRGSSGSEKIISALLPAINTIFNHENPKIQILALGSYDFFTDENYAKLFIENGVVKMCIGFLETSMDSNRFEFIMRFFQKMIDEGSDSDIQYFIDNGILRNVQKALKHFNEDVKLVGICLITSLVQSANGTQKHIIFNEPNLFSSIVNLLDHKNPSIRSSTLELLLKYIDRANSKEIIFSMFDSSNCIYQLCALLKENEMPVTILRILQNLLFKADNKTALNIRDILIDCKAEATMKESLSDDSTFLYAANLFSEFYDLNFWEKRAMSKSSHDEL